MTNPKVTIVTITYNSASFVQQAIESVLAQSYTDFEYIISDDCSTDNTWEIIQSYNDPRIRAWCNASNLGEYPNRNKTLSEAKGEYIIWIDGDDIFYPHGLEFMVRMLEAFPNSAMACARPYWSNMVYPYELSPLETFRFDYLGSPVTINGFPDTLFRTSVLKSVGGLPEHFISGDTFVKKYIAMYHNILLISNGVSWWRMPEGQASAKIRGTIVGLLEGLKIGEIFLDHDDCPLTAYEIDVAKVRMYRGFYRHLIKEYFLKFKVRTFFKHWRTLNLNVWEKISYIFSTSNKEYTGNSSAKNPLLLDFARNPYRKKLK